MSSIQLPPLPMDTARAAGSLFARDHRYMRLGQSLDRAWGRLDLASLESADRSLAKAFYPYALATRLQYWEGLTARQMAQATGTRLELKYAMHLPLRRPGVDSTGLCLFRRQTLGEEAGSRAMQALHDELASFARPEKEAQDVQQLIASICLRSRGEIILECMTVALEAIAATHPGWLSAHMQPGWYQRYHRRANDGPAPLEGPEHEKWLIAVGQDGKHLLRAVDDSGRRGMADLPE